MATMAQDYYQILGLSKNASAEEIQKAYRKLARQYHPDLNPDDKTAQQKFKDIQHAYDVLSDAEKRKMYDQFGPDFERMGGGGHPFQGGGGGGQPFGFEDIFGGGRAGGGFQFDGDMGDIFGQFAGGGQRSGRSRRRSAQPSKGRDIETELTIPFNTAILGGKAAIEVSRGGGRDTISLKIPPGIESGKKMRLRGQGEPALGKGQAGDLLVTIKIASHPYFRRNGKNLELKLPVTISEAALGATLDIPTPSGTVSLKIPPGSNSGSRLRVRGQGVLDPSGGPGDLMVEIQIKTPEGLAASESVDEKAKEALATIESLYQSDPRDGIIW